MMSSRPPPPQGAPPSYAFVTRVYQRNLRPVVLLCAFLSALWALFSAIGNFRSISVAKDQGLGSLVTFGIVLGVLHMGVFVCELFGMFAAYTQRLPLIRIYAYISALVTLIVFAAGLIQVIIHFSLKKDIINECSTFSTDKQVLYYPFGFWGPVSHDTISKSDAQDWCTNSWDHDSWADIVTLIVTLILAGMFNALAFAYYRQALDPTSVVNAMRAPSNQVRVGAFPSHYNPPYNTSVPNLGYGYNMPYAGGPFPQQPYQSAPAYAPPPGPPPHMEDSKPPGYTGGDGKGPFAAEKEDNPFADFDDGPSRRESERDVTSARLPQTGNPFR
ncbi:hypothetical protein EDD18DRAFT_1154968 [Armillaria luteobubalina]|uniref:Uncharacterized protein n=1 Tax=Armillaria luteobubalina TaxID=153913 RepID=A0AA39UZ43_9AGAR|nr:hypothetical protein EDD18DRAFT_1154968 [Armillaria luteobubalina]